MANYGKKVEVEVKVDEVITTDELQTVNTNLVKEAPAKKKKIDKDEDIACRSVVNGGLIYTSKRTNQTIEWESYGATQYVTVEELMTMKSQQKAFLNEPWIIIEDEDVVAHLGLKSIYDRIIPIDNLEEFLLYSQVEEIVQAIQKAPKGAKDLIADKSREMVANETLYDIRIIKAINKELNIDLTMIQD